MFTWICPKCGGEVPPAYDDCPRCSPPKKVQAEEPVPVAAEVTTPPAQNPSSAYQAPAGPAPPQAAPASRVMPPPPAPPSPQQSWTQPPQPPQYPPQQYSPPQYGPPQYGQPQYPPQQYAQPPYAAPAPSQQPMQYHPQPQPEYRGPAPAYQPPPGPPQQHQADPVPPSTTGSVLFAAPTRQENRPSAPVYDQRPQSHQPPPPPVLSTSGTLFGQPAPPVRTSDATPYRAQPQSEAPRQASPLLVAGGAAIGIIALLLLLYTYVLPHRSSDTASAKSDQASAEKSVDPAAAAGTTHPLAKHIEVSGVRIQESSGGKVKIDFNVVNHSAADLPDLKLDVRLRSGNRDFFVVPVKLPSLGPYASKDLSTTVKTDLKPYELPDWQRVEPRFTVQDASSSK